MSIIVRGMKMPDHCINCPFMISRDDDDCILQSEEANSNFENWKQMRDDCPLVELPEKHGRLIDADALMDIFADRLVKVSGRYGIDSAVAGAVSGAMGLVDLQPTVIEAEENK